LHQWIGVLGGLLAGFHLLLHWSWFDTVSQRFWQGISHNVRFKYLLDSSLLLGFVAIISTGLVISSWLNLTLTNYGTWLSIHILGSIFTLITLFIKIGLHWKWIARTSRTTFAQPQPALAMPGKAASTPVRSDRMDRREFLKVMGVASGASLLALLSASNSLVALQNDATTTAVETTTTNTVSQSSSTNEFSQSSTNDTSASTTCTIQCNKHCSYPGHCRRYTDANQDNYCDLGQCA
jgi:uncharacterized membrane protein YbhN (UPF0104 family)